MSGVLCGECAKPSAHFDHEAFTVTYDGLSSEVTGLSGWRCESCGDIIFDPDSAERYAAAGDALILQARDRQARELKRIRTRLGLTQHSAAALTGGGHNAFSRYERGEVPPMPAVVNLFKLLDRHPDLLHELQAARPARRKPAHRPAASA